MSIRQRLQRLEEQNTSCNSQIPCNVLFVERDGRLTSPNGTPAGDWPAGQGVVLLERPCVTVDEWLESVRQAEQEQQVRA